MATALKDTTRVEGRHDASNWPTLESVADVVRQTRNTVDDVRHATKDAAERLELVARRRPLAAAGVAGATRVPGAWCSCHEANDVLLPVTCLEYPVTKPLSRVLQRLPVGVGSADLRYRVTRVNRASGLDDGRRRVVAAAVKLLPR